MPNPRSDETQSDFIDRCMSDSEAINSFPDEDQRYAFCNSQWENKGEIMPTTKGKELFDFLVRNKSYLIAQKKFQVKKGDAVSYAGSLQSNNGKIVKAGLPLDENRDTLDVTSVINTTYWMDSYKDVHIDGMWKKTLSETPGLYLLQEHKMEFEKIISEEVKAYTRRISWKSLGVNAEGNTEALVFESKVEKSRNPFMFGQYRKGYVKNHSVGMMYGKLALAINDEDYPNEKATWDKYYSKIANKDAADESGYFWAVTEGKVIEGSAVPIGANRITPTTSVKNIEPVNSTQPKNEPSKDTRMLTELNKLLLQTKKVK